MTMEGNTASTSGASTRPDAQAWLDSSMADMTIRLNKQTDQAAPFILRLTTATEAARTTCNMLSELQTRNETNTSPTPSSSRSSSVGRSGALSLYINNEDLQGIKTTLQSLHDVVSEGQAAQDGIAALMHKLSLIDMRVFTIGGHGNPLTLLPPEDQDILHKAARVYGTNARDDPNVFSTQDRTWMRTVRPCLSRARLALPHPDASICGLNEALQQFGFACSRVQAALETAQTAEADLKACLDDLTVWTLRSASTSAGVEEIDEFWTWMRGASPDTLQTGWQVPPGPGDSQQDMETAAETVEPLHTDFHYEPPRDQSLENRYRARSRMAGAMAMTWAEYLQTCGIAGPAGVQ